MAPKTTSPPFTYPYPYQAVFDAILAVAPQVPLQVQFADPATGTIKASAPMTFMSWGEWVTVTLWQPQPGYTGITVTSELKFGLWDPWGFNRRKIDKFFAIVTPYLDWALAALRAPQPPPG
jgi:hypothetical protein